MKNKILTIALALFSLINLRAQVEDIKIFKFSTSGQIGSGRTSGYLPCFEPFYLRINADELPGKKITQVKIWFYDSQGSGKSSDLFRPVVIDPQTKVVTMPASNKHTTFSIYESPTTNPTSKVFTSIRSGTNELIIYVDALLDFKRYYYYSYEVEYMSNGDEAAAATAHLDSNRVNSIVIDKPGENFESTPTIQLIGGGGTGATANAVLTNGRVTSITIVDSGSNYTSAPTVVIYGVKTGGNKIYATALKEDVKSVETYTGVGWAMFTTKEFDVRPSFTLAAGAKIHFKPVYFHPARSRYNLHPCGSRFSLTLGAALGSLSYRNSDIKPLPGFVNLIVGLDFEPVEYFSIHVGAVCGMQDIPYASSNEKRPVAGLFIGLNITPTVFAEAGKNSSGFKMPSGS